MEEWFDPLLMASRYPGKTVLASFIFEDVKTFCKDSALEGTGWAYYYCYFGHKQEETPHLLRWVINQLCRQINAIPDEVRQLFLTGGSSKTHQLTVALGAVLRNYHCVYLVIDALDESLERDRILNLLIDILDDHSFKKLQVLATSRKELDIERALLNISVDISLSNPYVDEDIRVYIQNTLRDNHKFSRWPEELRGEIEMALVKGAKGMYVFPLPSSADLFSISSQSAEVPEVHRTDSPRFRWVLCQLDILKRLNTIPDIRKALSELPRTLDEMYERILCSIPVENHSIAYRTLQLLAFDLGIKKLGVLLDALAVDVDRCTFSRDDRILDPEALLEVCTCLITITPAKRENKDYFEVQLAHYTVKEYLVSDRIGRGSATTFQMSKESVYTFAAKCFITYMLDEDYHRLLEPDASGLKNLRGLMRVAMNQWAPLVRGIQSYAARMAIIPLVLRLLNVTGPHFQNWIKAGKKLSGLLNKTSKIREWAVTPGGESCLTLVYLCYFDLFGAAQQFVENLPEPVSFETEIKVVLPTSEFDDLKFSGMLDDIEEGKLLHIAALMGRVSVIKYFLSKGADINAISAKGLSVLVSAVNRGWWCYRTPQSALVMVELLLKMGADPNLPGVSSTPLQRLISVWSEHQDVAVTMAISLLNAGADVNGVGDDESNISGLLLTIEDYRLQISGNELDKYDFEDITAKRDKMWNYDSPLRIVDRLMKRPYDREQDKLWSYNRHLRIVDGLMELPYNLERAKLRLTEMKKLLISHGAKSIHQSPKRNLPIHVRARIKGYFRSIGHELSSPMLRDDSESLVELDAGACPISQDIAGGVDEQEDSRNQVRGSLRFEMLENSIYKFGYLLCRFDDR